jgi:hypothetical protein
VFVRRKAEPEDPGKLDARAVEITCDVLAELQQLPAVRGALERLPDWQLTALRERCIYLARRWLGPIPPHTAEDAWTPCPGRGAQQLHVCELPAGHLGRHSWEQPASAASAEAVASVRVGATVGYVLSAGPHAGAVRPAVVMAVEDKGLTLNVQLRSSDRLSAAGTVVESGGDAVALVMCIESVAFDAAGLMDTWHPFER